MQWPLHTDDDNVFADVSHVGAHRGTNNEATLRFGFCMWFMNSTKIHHFQQIVTNSTHTHASDILSIHSQQTHWVDALNCCFFSICVQILALSQCSILASFFSIIRSNEIIHMDLNNRILVEKWISIRLVHGRFSHAVAIERSGLLTLCVYFFYLQLSCMCFAKKKY